MASVERITRICDRCGAEGDRVMTRWLIIDTTAVELELCPRHWAASEATFAVLEKAGRTTDISVAKRHLKRIQEGWPFYDATD